LPMRIGVDAINLRDDEGSDGPVHSKNRKLSFFSLDFHHVFQIGDIELTRAPLRQPVNPFLCILVKCQVQTDWFKRTIPNTEADISTSKIREAEDVLRDLHPCSSSVIKFPLVVHIGRFKLTTNQFFCDFDTQLNHYDLPFLNAANR